MKAFKFIQYGILIKMNISNECHKNEAGEMCVNVNIKLPRWWPINWLVFIAARFAKK